MSGHESALGWTELLEVRVLLTSFTENGTTLEIDLGASESVQIASNGSTYTLTGSANWSGTDSANVTGNGTTTLTVTAAGLTAFDTVTITDSGAGAAVSFNDSGANAYADTINVTLDDAAAGTVTFNGATSFTGTVGLSVLTERNIVMASGSSITTVSGDISLTANDSAGSSGDFQGILLTGATISTTSGAITLDGTGGDEATAERQSGVQLDNGSTIESTGTGTVGDITITGQGGSGRVAIVGVEIAGTGDGSGTDPSVVTSVDADILITGTGGTSTDKEARGLVIREGSSVTATGTGSIELTGTGASGDRFNDGIGIGGVAGTLSGGNVVDVTSTAAVTIQTNSGSITLTGTPGTDSTSRGIAILTSGDNVTSTSGDVSLITDNLQFNTGVEIASAGDLVIRPQTASTSIGLGGGAGTLNLTDAELGFLQDGFASITIGDATNGTGAVIVDSATFNDPVTIASPASGGTITVNGQITGAGDASVTLDGATTTLAADIVTEGNAITVTGAAVLGADVTIDSTNGGSNTGGAGVSFQSTVDSDSTARTLTVDADGTTFFAADVGSTNPLAALTTDAAGTTEFFDLDFAPTVEIANFNFDSSRASIDTDPSTSVSIFTSPSTVGFFEYSATPAGGSSAAAIWAARDENLGTNTFYQFTVTPNSDTAAVSFGRFAFDAFVFDNLGGTTAFDYRVFWSVDDFATPIASGTGPSISGTGNQEDQASFNFDLSALAPQSSSVTFRLDPIFGAGSGTNGANFQRSGAVDNVILRGATASPIRVTTTGSQTYNDSVTFNTDITLAGDEIDFGGGADSVSGAVNLTLAPSAASTTIGVGGGAGTLDVSDTDLAALADGFTSIIIGEADSGDIDVNTATFNDPVMLVTGGRIHDAASGTDIDAGTDLVTLGGTIAPGQSSGMLTVNGDFAFADDSTFEVEIGGTDGAGVDPGGHDQLDVTGTVTIGSNVTLDLPTFNSFTPAVGDTFTIINNDGSDAVVGTFEGVPEGGRVSGSGWGASVTYMGGDGNDVVLTAVIDTEITLSGGTLTITDIDGGTSNDDLTISYSGGMYTITDSGQVIDATAVGGGVGTSVTFADTGVTGILFDVLGGDDSVTVDSVQDSLSGDFTITGGTGNDSATINGSVATTGTGAINVTVSENIVLNSGSSLTTVDGGITLNANADGSHDVEFIGINADGATIQTTGNGNIQLSGKGSELDQDDFFFPGVFLTGGTTVSSTSTNATAGTITIEGTGADGLSSNIGVGLSETSTIVTSVAGDITITGTGGDGPDGFNNGVELFGGAVVESTGTGADAADIMIHGTAGIGEVSLGVFVAAFSDTAGIRSVDGDIQVNGTGGASTGDFNEGIGLNGDGPLPFIRSTGDGNITLTGVGDATDGANNHGIGLNGGGLVEVTTGNLLATGTGGANSAGISVGIDGNVGIFSSAGGGSISLIGNVGSGSVGIQMPNAADSRIGDASSTGNISLTGDSIDIQNGQVLTTTGSITITADTLALNSVSSIDSDGSLTIQPRTDDTTIGLGGGTGTLNLDDTELTTLQDGFSSITIGNATSGDIDVDTATFSDSVTLVSGGTVHDATGTDITVGSGDTVTVNGTLAPGQSPGITDISGHFAFADGSTFEVEVGGTSPATTPAADEHDQLVTTGTITIGSNVTLDLQTFDSFEPSESDTFTIIDNGSDSAVSGTFNGLAEGGAITLGSSRGTISYVGGDGNDVVITIDNTVPTATITVADTDLIAESSTVTIVFSEAVTGFTSDDLTVSNGTVSAVTTNDNITFSATLRPNLGVQEATNLITLDNTGVTDLAGNPGTGTTDSNNYAIDTVTPVTPDVRLPGGDLYDVLRDGDDLVLRVRGGMELFRAISSLVSELTITGSPDADTVTVLNTGIAVSTPIVFDGRAGADTFNGAAATGPLALNGGRDNDLLVGGLGDDTLKGDAGMDTLDGAAGNDVLRGGVDSDTLEGRAGLDVLFGDEGDDQLEGGPDRDFMRGGEGADNASGGTGNDTLIGDAGDDTLAGNGGRDSLDGGLNDDDLFGFGDADTLIGSDGNDRLQGGVGNDLMLGGVGQDTLRGEDGDDHIEGGPDGDLIGGGADNDSLSGDAGDDTLTGGTGNDTLTGGAGSDRLDGGQDDDSLFGFQGQDTLIGSEGNDRLAGGVGNDSLEDISGMDTLLGEDGDDTLTSDGGDDTLRGGEGTDTINGVVDPMALALGELLGGL